MQMHIYDDTIDMFISQPNAQTIKYTFRNKREKVAEHVPTHLGRGALHMWRPPPKHTISFAPCRR